MLKGTGWFCFFYANIVSQTIRKGETNEKKTTVKQLLASSGGRCVMYRNRSGISSIRRTDEEHEKNMRNALNEIYRENGFAIERMDDRESQLKGIDLFMYKDNICWVVDEKAATSRNDAYTKLRTFCFEIAAPNNLDGIGWLYQEDKETTHYALIYPKSEDGFITLDSVEILFVPKRTILELLFNEGIAGPRDATELLKNGRFDYLGRRYYYLNDAIKLMTSYQLAEEPTNAIIDRGLLRRISDSSIRIG